MVPKISIIIPIYNSEKTINKCVDSVLSQTYTDFELLLVNDGSIDSSAQICDEYAKTDNRVIVFHKVNGGASSARNYGIDKAKGEYIAFLDSDDWLEKDFLKNLIQFDSYDFIVGGFKRVGNLVGEIKPKNTCEITVNEELVKHWESSVGEFVYWYIWGKLFKAEIIRKKNIRFDETIKYTEDFAFVVGYLLHIDRFYIVSNADIVHYAEPFYNNKYAMNFESLKHLCDFEELHLQRLDDKCNKKIIKIRESMYFRFLTKYVSFLQQTEDKGRVACNLQQFRSTDDLWKKYMLNGLRTRRGRRKYLLFRTCLILPKTSTCFGIYKLLKF